MSRSPDVAIWLSTPAADPDPDAEAAARQRQSELTKPPGALGQLEQLAIRLAGLQRVHEPRVDRVQVVVFAADHGIVAEGVSAFPQAVTGEMIRNFARGGAAINVLVRRIGADMRVINLGTAGDIGTLPGVSDCRLGPGTASFRHHPAMNAEQLERALALGRDAAERAGQAGSQLFIAGEMGIGNTTSAAALACALLRQPAAAITGPGTGLDASGVSHKAAVIEQAIDHHQAQLDPPLATLQHLGGFEIAAMVGALAACAQRGLPVLVDGFIASVAALFASRLCPGSQAWFLYAHRSAEPGHAAILDALEAEPLLDLGMRLGEGSGAAVAVPLLRQACALHNDMATFAEAGVDNE